MATELQIAPTPEIVEVPDAIEDIPEMVAHIYHFLCQEALCGVRAEDDPHNLMHQRTSRSPSQAPPGTTACVECGAPCCEECFARNK